MLSETPERYVTYVRLLYHSYFSFIHTSHFARERKKKRKRERERLYIREISKEMRARSHFRELSKETNNYSVPPVPRRIVPASRLHAYSIDANVSLRLHLSYHDILQTSRALGASLNASSFLKWEYLRRFLRDSTFTNL